jgi:hypothetical protein
VLRLVIHGNDRIDYARDYFTKWEKTLPANVSKINVCSLYDELTMFWRDLGFVDTFPGINQDGDRYMCKFL